MGVRALDLEREPAKITSSGGGQMSVYNVFACASMRAMRLPFGGVGGGGRGRGH